MDAGNRASIDAICDAFTGVGHDRMGHGSFSQVVVSCWVLERKLYGVELSAVLRGLLVIGC